MKPRTRLSPELRKEQLLDTAKNMIVAEGLQSFTMEALARTAEVSSPLVYNYFEGRQDLLQLLLKREFQTYVEKLTMDVAQADNFEDVVRVFIASNFDHHAPGNVIPILQSQPDISIALEQARDAHGNQIANYLVHNAAVNYQLTRPQAELVVSMSSGASVAAAEYASGKNRKRTIETTLSYILAGMKHIASQNG